MSKLRYAIVLTIILFSSLPAICFPDSIYITVDRLSSLIPSLTDLDKEELIVNKKLTRFYYDEQQIDLYMPEMPIAEEITDTIRTIEPNMGVESVYLLRIPSSAEYEDDGEQFMLGLYNLLRNVSSLEGIEYYSASRSRMRTFFKQFYPVKSVENPEKVEDPLVDSIPSYDTMTIFQHDLTFGKNFSSLVYRYANPFINLSITNLKTMWYGILPLIGPEHMQIHLVITPFRDHIIFYGNCGVKMAISLFGIEKSKTDSFSNRIEALYNWFSKEASRFFSESLF
jgi:hypothetical protein